MKPYFLLIVLFAVSGSVLAQKNVNTTKSSTIREKSVKVNQSIDQGKSVASKELVVQNAEVSPKDKKYTIDNCVTEFSMSKAEKTKAGCQFWFADRDFIDGRTLKMSVVGPHSATHPPHKHIEDEFFFILEGTAQFFLDGKTKVAGPYTSFYCPSNVEHGISNVGDSILKYLVIKKYQQKEQNPKIGVITDIHFMDPSLLIKEDTAFEKRMQSSRTLLKESPAILDATVDRFIKEKVNLVLITGDMTKDGEFASHKGVIQRLDKLAKNGIKVLVVPGNHDVDNKQAYSYDGDKTTPVRNATASDFINLYSDFGFKDALAKDSFSLSYISEPLPGLRVISFDDCNSINKPETKSWLFRQLDSAKVSGKKVICMMHRNVVEHFDYEGTFTNYMTNDFAGIQQKMLETGVSMVFTGHFHASDIAMCESTEGKKLYDIETGSLSAYPSPYRLIDFSGNSFDIKTCFIDSIGVKLPNNLDYQTYAFKEAEMQVSETVKYLLYAYYPRISASIPKSAAAFIKIPDKETLFKMASVMMPEVTDLMVSHYSGNENLADSAEIKRDILLKKADLFISDLAKASAGFMSPIVEKTIRNSQQYYQLQDIIKSISNDCPATDYRYGNILIQPNPVNDLNFVVK
jgi:quercetin dioxygenase-like cupin family protein/UDP-2,3-diacylglucosamine pyrophosphatase LpxH